MIECFIGVLFATTADTQYISPIEERQMVSDAMGVFNDRVSKIIHESNPRESLSAEPFEIVLHSLPNISDKTLDEVLEKIKPLMQELQCNIAREVAEDSARWPEVLKKRDGYVNHAIGKLAVFWAFGGSKEIMVPIVDCWSETFKDKPELLKAFAESFLAHAYGPIHAWPNKAVQQYGENDLYVMPDPKDPSKEIRYTLDVNQEKKWFFDLKQEFVKKLLEPNQE